MLVRQMDSFFRNPTVKGNLQTNVIKRKWSHVTTVPHKKPVSRKIPHIPCTVILYLLNSKILLSPAENKYQSEFAVRISLFSCTKNNTFYDFRVINMRSFYEDQSFLLRNVFTLSQQAAKKSQHQERQNYILRNFLNDRYVSSCKHTM